MITPSNELKYRRVLLKLSGEALMGEEAYGIDPKIIDRLACEISELSKKGAEIAIVIGGGNIGDSSDIHWLEAERFSRLWREHW